jgi:uncharacterized protein (DUF1684 family)
VTRATRSIFFSIVAAIAGTASFGQDETALEEIQAFRDELNAQYADPEKSPLTDKDRTRFKALEFFPIDTDFRVTARFVRTPGQAPFEMKTTTARTPVYEKYGEAHFMLGDSSFVLNLYQSHSAREKPEYAHLLFLPFTDLTNGFGSYGGGRYIDVEIPEGDTVVIDFNQAYNPYCCYNHKYSCPIPPKENFLNFRVAAGVKAFGKKE